jgi:hypothetical protein
MHTRQGYIPLEMPLLAKTTQDRYQGVINNYLIPAFGRLCLPDLTPATLQRYCSGTSSRECPTVRCHKSPWRTGVAEHRLAMPSSSLGTVDTFIQWSCRWSG